MNNFLIDSLIFLSGIIVALIIRAIFWKVVHYIAEHSFNLNLQFDANFRSFKQEKQDTGDKTSYMIMLGSDYAPSVIKVLEPDRECTENNKRIIYTYKIVQEEEE